MGEEQLMKKLIILFLFGVAWLCQAGDIAVFSNLGFSDDSKYFMFVQYGVRAEESTPYAELFLVDVKQNIFVPGGTSEFNYSRNVEPGDDGAGALFKILEDNLPLTGKYGINHLARGRILYQLLNGATPKETLQFRDFNTGNHYTVKLIQTASGSAEDVKSSFYIELTIAYASGRTSTKTIGHAAYKRAGVKNYKIRQMFLSPDDTSLIIVLEKEQYIDDELCIRYMVESAKIE